MRHGHSREQRALGFHEFGTRTGRPIVFLHGATQTGEVWVDVANLLPDHRAICIDLPGNGLSYAHAFTSLEDAADAVAATIKEMSPDAPVPVMGLSLGAFVAFTLASRHPDCVHSTIVSGLQTSPYPITRWTIPSSVLLCAVINSFWMRKRMAQNAGIAKTSSAWPQRDPPSSASTLREQARAAALFDARAQLGNPAPPFLAIAGEEETAPILNSLKDISALVPGSRSLIVPGDHVWPAVRPDLLAQLLIHWIEDGRVPPGLVDRIVSERGEPEGQGQ